MAAEPQPQPAGDPPSLRQVAAGSAAATGAPAGGFVVGGAADLTGTSAAYAAAAVAGAAGEAAVARGARAIIDAFRRFLRKRGNDDVLFYVATLQRAVDAGEITGSDLADLRQEELERERQFQAKALLRWQKMIPQLLATPTPEARAEVVGRFQAQERRILDMRRKAMTERAHGAIERMVLRRLSPRGAYWKLDPHVREHTLDCLAMGRSSGPGRCSTGFTRRATAGARASCTASRRRSRAA
jgi:hypothetical protein